LAQKTKGMDMSRKLAWMDEPYVSVWWWLLEKLALILPSIALGWFVYLATRSFWWGVVAYLLDRRLEEIPRRVKERP
jgi:hypothetical protein